jgi:hypothetical protein
MPSCAIVVAELQLLDARLSVWPVVPPPRHQYGYRDPGLTEIYLPFGELVPVIIMRRSRYFWQLAAGVGLRYLAYMMPSFGFRGEQGRYANDANIEPSAAAGLPTSTVDLEAFAQFLRSAEFAALLEPAAKG